MTQFMITLSDVAAAFETFPEERRAHLLKLRQLIFETAAQTPGVGPLDECLKWGQPAYLTQESKSGTTLRLGLNKAGAASLFVHCQTSLISEFRAQFPESFGYDGTRAIHLDQGEEVDFEALRLFISRALTYHL